MCLAVPMRIREILPNGIGLGDLDGAEHEVDLSLVADPHVGDYVIVHAGYAIEILNETEADARIALFAELAKTMPPPGTQER